MISTQVALVDDAAEAMPHHANCPFMMSLFFGALIGMVFLARKIRANRRTNQIHGPLAALHPTHCLICEQAPRKRS